MCEFSHFLCEFTSFLEKTVWMFPFFALTMWIPPFLDKMYEFPPPLFLDKLALFWDKKLWFLKMIFPTQTCGGGGVFMEHPPPPNVDFPFQIAPIILSIFPTFLSDNQVWFLSQKVPQVHQTPTLPPKVVFSLSKRAYNIKYYFDFFWP